MARKSDRPKHVRYRRADGSVAVYTYDRAAGRPAPAKPADPQAFERRAVADGGPHAPLRNVMRAWRYSREFARLAAATQANYNFVAGHPALAELLDLPCSAITKRALRTLRDDVAAAGIVRRGREAKPLANLILSVLSACFAWGIENFDLESNPVAGIKRLEVEGGHLPWSDAAVAAWLERAPEWARRAIQLGLWTALRASDVIALRWDQWDGAAIRHRAGKTRRHAAVPELYIPLSPEANATLAAWRSDAPAGLATLTILAQSEGRPWRSANYLALQLARTRAAHDLPTGTMHGLRVTAATRLIEAGVPSRDVMALTGHIQERTFAKYIRQADQRQRAERAARAWASVTPLRGRAGGS